MNPLASDPIEQFLIHTKEEFCTQHRLMFLRIWVATMTQFYLTVLLLAVMLV